MTQDALVCTAKFSGQRNTLRRVVVVVVVVFLMVRLFLIATTFPVVDEVAHLPAGVSHLKYGRFDLYRVNPPLVRTIAALGTLGTDIPFDWNLYRDDVGARPEFEIGRLQLERQGLLYRGNFYGPRLCVFCVYCVFLYVFYRLLRMYTDDGAFLTLGFFAACPNQIANSVLIAPDAIACLAGAIACLCIAKSVERPTCNSVIDAGFALGIALLTKLTWVTLLVSLPAVVLLSQLRKSSFRQIVQISVRQVCILAIALFVLNLGYLFENPLPRLSRMDVVSTSFRQWQHSRFAGLPLPLPENYLLGIDYLRYEVEEKKMSFLFGQWKMGSWPHYYAVTTLCKTPEPILAALALGLWVFVAGVWRGIVDSKTITMFSLLGLPAIVCFISVSLQGGFNHHHRYVLMIYPIVFALGGYVVSPVGKELLFMRLPFLGSKKRRLSYPLALVLITLTAASSLRVHPYYTSYFNSACGGPENGWRLLGFSNIDWGQDIMEVDKWIKAHPECRPIAFDLDYLGLNGELFGLPYAFPSKSTNDSRFEPQWWIVSVRSLYNVPGQKGLEYLQRIRPVDKIAYSYFVYRIDPVALGPPQHDGDMR